MGILDNNEIDQEDDIEPLRRRLIRRKMMENLDNLDTESGNIIIPAMGGALDNLSKFYASSLDPVATVTRLPIHGHANAASEDHLRKLMVDRSTRNKQQALDDTRLLSSIEANRVKRADMSRKEGESDKKYGFLREKLAADNSAKAARLGWDKEKEDLELEKAYYTLDAIMGRQENQQKWKSGESEKERAFKSEEKQKDRDLKEDQFNQEIERKINQANDLKGYRADQLDYLRNKTAEDIRIRGMQLGLREKEIQAKIDQFNTGWENKFKYQKNQNEFVGGENDKNRKQKDKMFASELGRKMDEFHKNYEFKRAKATGDVIHWKAQLEIMKDKLKADTELRGLALGQSQQKIDMALDMIDKKHENEMEKLDKQQEFQAEQKDLDRQNKIKVKQIPSGKAGGKGGFSVKEINKMSQDFGKAVDAYANRAGAFGNVAKKLMAAEAVNGLFQQYPDYNIPPTATHELAAAIAGLVQNGSPQSQQQINNLTPESYRGNWEAWASKLLNEPRGLQQQKFMKMLHETAAREYLISRKQREEIIKSRLPDHWSYFQVAPDQAQKQLAARLGMKDTMSTTPIVMEMAKKMGMDLSGTAPSITGEPVSHAPSQNATNKAGTAIMSPKQQKAKAWAESHLNDPANAVKAQNILKDLKAKGF